MSDWPSLEDARGGDSWPVDERRAARRRRAIGTGTAVAVTALGGATSADAAIPPPTPDGLPAKHTTATPASTAPAPAAKPPAPRKPVAPASTKAPPPPGLLPPVGPVKTVPAKPQPTASKPTASKPKAKPAKSKFAPARPALPPNADKLPLPVRIAIGAEGSGPGSSTPPARPSKRTPPVLLPPVGDAVVIDRDGSKTTVHPGDTRYPTSATKPTVPKSGTTTAPPGKPQPPRVEPSGPQPTPAASSPSSGQAPASPRPTASPTPSPSAQAPPPAKQPPPPADPLPPLPGEPVAGDAEPQTTKPPIPKPVGSPPVLLPPVGDATVVDRQGRRTVVKPGSPSYPKSAATSPTEPTQYQRDRAAALPNLEAMGVTSPAQAEAARRRLARPIAELQGRINELQDAITDLEGRGVPGAVREAKKELADRQLQLLLYTNQACDYDCDLDAPYRSTGIEHLNEAARALGGYPSVRAVVAYAIRLEAARQQIKSLETSGPGLHDVLNVAGYIPVLGAVFDGVNGAYYYAEGNAEEGAWAMAGAVPFAGDAAKGARTARRVYNGLEDAKDAKTAARIIEEAGKAGGKAEARFAQNMAKKIQDPESRKALEGIFKATASGTRANAKYFDKFLPSRTRGYASELKTLDRLGKDPSITRIRLIPAKRGRRSPDFVVTRGGEDVRVEVTTYTGAKRGYSLRRIGRAKPASQRDIENLINRKVGGKRTQFNSDLPGVKKGGELDAHLRGGVDSVADVDRSVGNMTRSMLGQGLTEARFTIGPGTVLRYVRQGDRYVRQP